MTEAQMFVLLFAMVASTVSFLPTLVVTFRRWFRGQQTASGRVVGLTLGALMVFQLILFSPYWVFEHWSFVVLLVVIATLVCTLNLASFRELQNLVRAEAGGDGPA